MTGLPSCGMASSSPTKPPPELHMKWFSYYISLKPRQSPSSHSSSSSCACSCFLCQQLPAYGHVDTLNGRNTITHHEPIANIYPQSCSVVHCPGPSNPPSPPLLASPFFPDRACAVQHKCCRLHSQRIELVAHIQPILSGDTVVQSLARPVRPKRIITYDARLL